MVIDSLLVKLNSTGIFTQGYSNDVLCLVCGDFEDTVEDLLRTAIKIVEKWCGENHPKVNLIKTKVILFSRRRTEKNLAIGKFKIFGKSVSLKAAVKYLGVTIDCRLTWIIHMNDKINKAIGIFWMCRNSFGRNWGLSPRAIWWIYTAVVRPMLCHRCVVWWPRVDIHTTATRALETILSLSPLDLYIKSAAFNTSDNIKSNG